MSKRAKSPRLEPVGGIIAGVLNELGLSAPLREWQAVQVWDKVVGEKVSQHTQAYGIDKGELAVRVDSHAWMQELQFLKPDIIRKLNTELGADIIRDIRFALACRRQS
jgi:predicted nucleic acid-binding Zn ribbon protein